MLQWTHPLLDATTKASPVTPTAGANPRRSRSLRAALAAGAVVLTTVAGCTSNAGDAAQSASASPSAEGATTDAASNTSILDSSTVHSISVDVDPDSYQAMIDSYVDSGEKEWISAAVTIDGTVFTDVGIKLKGNSSLMGLRGPGATAGGAGGTGNAQGDDGTGTASTSESTASTSAQPSTGAGTAPDPAASR